MCRVSCPLPVLISPGSMPLADVWATGRGELRSASADTAERSSEVMAPLQLPQQQVRVPHACATRTAPMPTTKLPASLPSGATPTSEASAFCPRPWPPPPVFSSHANPSQLLLEPSMSPGPPAAQERTTEPIPQQNQTNSPPPGGGALLPG